MKIYPVLVLAPLFIFRKKKAFIVTIITLLVLILFCPHLWLEFLQEKLLVRATMGGIYFGWGENGSIANTFLWFAIFINKISSFFGLKGVNVSYFIISSFFVYFIMFSIMIVADYKIFKKYNTLDYGTEISSIMMYFPFMVAVPKVAFQYELVILFPLVPMLCFLWQKHNNPMSQKIVLLFIIGIAMSQIQAVALQKLFNPKYEFPHFFPGFGLFLVMISCIVYKFWLYKEMSHKPVHRE